MLIQVRPGLAAFYTAGARRWKCSLNRRCTVLSERVLNDRIYRVLVPDAPLHKRTEQDSIVALIGNRISSLNIFRSQQTAKPGVAAPSLISSWSGSIDALLLTLPSYGVQSPELEAGYRSVIDSMRIGTEFIVVHNEGDRRTLERWFEAADHSTENVLYVPLPDYVSFTDWAEDGYVALTDTKEGATYLVEPWTFPRSGDALIADVVEEYSNIRASQAPLIFQGGNCLVGDDFWLLGADYFVDSLELLQDRLPPVRTPAGTTEVDFIHQLFGEYVDSHRKLHLIGTKRALALRSYYGRAEAGKYYLDVPGGGTGALQPIFHIDMFITLVGRNDNGAFRVLVGSPELADKILETSSPFSLQAAYDSIANDLESKGMEVYRNPLAHRSRTTRNITFADLRDLASSAEGVDLREAVGELQAAGARPESDVAVREWSHVTWNNCLVENSVRVGRNVYMPTFGHGENAELAQLDEEMQRIWEGLQFSVHRLTDFNAFASRQGVVHCIKKYLKRGD